MPASQRAGQHAKQALEMFQAMQLQGVVSNVITYNALVSTCEKGQQAKWALEMLQAMQLEGVVPDMITYNALISAC